MLTSRDLATIRAALRYWREEVSIHGPEAAAPYFDLVEPRPLGAAEMGVPFQNLQTARYGYYDRRTEGLRTTALIHEIDLPIDDRADIATILLPAGNAFAAGVSD